MFRFAPDRASGTDSGIQLIGVGKVYVTQDSVESLRIESDDSIIGFVETNVPGGVLAIQLRDGSYNNIMLRIYATVKRPGLLSCSGAEHAGRDTHNGLTKCRCTHLPAYGGRYRISVRNSN